MMMMMMMVVVVVVMMSKGNTYVNAALHTSNLIDFILTFSSSDAVDFDILEPGINFSDHLPVTAKFNYHLDKSNAPELKILLSPNQIKP